MSAPLTSIKGIGPRRAETLGKLGLFSVLDLAYYAPRAYRDYTSPVLAVDAQDGCDAVIRVRLLGAARTAYIRRSLTITSAGATDGAGKLSLVWYNQPFRAKAVHEGMCVFASGRVDKRRGVKLVNPMLTDELPGIVPVYSVPAGISQKLLHEAIISALGQSRDDIGETLPPYLMERYGLPPLYDALRELHSPASFDSLKNARRRLAFEDMLLFSLMLSLLRKERASKPGIAFKTKGALERFLSKLPFAPTNAQLRAMREIEADMASPAQMNRLVQGDVGSGKTAVAMFAMSIALENGMTAALMAPTEILARQHYETLRSMFGDSAVLLLGGMKKKERDAALERLSGGACALVGTHALISGSVEIPSLGLVISDEQHRFGVRQRAAIAAKGACPDAVIMSATPIPRTLSLILYGDLDASVIDELPPGRRPVVTRTVPESRRRDMYRFIEKEIRSGRQAYVVCPLIEPSDALLGAKSAKDVYGELSGALEAKTALIYGKLREKDDVARRFAEGEIDLLVSTSVVEVGVDVPNASVMVIEGAERFGLSQLHQLRGRVGRGEAQSYCFLLSESASESARERLETLCRTSDGFEIAEKDLMMRGPGELLGQRQHGAGELDETRFASDMSALTDAREAAEELVSSGSEDAAALRAKALALLEKREGTIAVN